MINESRSTSSSADQTNDGRTCGEPNWIRIGLGTARTTSARGRLEGFPEWLDWAHVGQTRVPGRRPLRTSRSAAEPQYLALSGTPDLA